MFFQAEDGIRDLVRSRGLGDVYKRQILPRDVSLATQVSRTIRLNIPLLSAAMDTVTEARLAIALAQEGGIGIVHKNLPPRTQAAEVAKVKRFESGVLKDPITIQPDICLLYTSPSPRDRTRSRMPSSA